MLNTKGFACRLDGSQVNLYLLIAHVECKGGQTQAKRRLSQLPETLESDVDAVPSLSTPLAVTESIARHTVLAPASEVSWDHHAPSWALSACAVAAGDVLLDPVLAVLRLGALGLGLECQQDQRVKNLRTGRLRAPSDRHASCFMRMDSPSSGGQNEPLYVSNGCLVHEKNASEDWWSKGWRSMVLGAPPQ